MIQSPLCIINNGTTTVGVAPKAGGRVVLLCRDGGENVLKVDPVLLNGHRWRGKVTPLSRFEQWNGHTVWLGPQSDWWRYQQVHPRRRSKAAVWPPDPFIEKAAYTVTHRDEHRISMRSPESPISGVRLDKTVEVTPDGAVRFRVTATNTRAQPLSWDLWLNTRVDGYARCYVPFNGDGRCRIEGPRVKRKVKAEVIAHENCDGFFTFVPQRPSPHVPKRWAKAFLHPSDGLIAAFRGRDVLLIRFPRHEEDAIHPKQALVELYNAVSHDRDDALLELEYHAPYRTLEPGASMTAEQTWELHPYSGGESIDEHRAFVREVGQDISQRRREP
ncbi:MAG: DUF4380 domain-containing protein [Chitinivibrionales bacterium]|nr:DUF4380 domain-containing protein [Chitinivibrionales bacterium]